MCTTAGDAGDVGDVGDAGGRSLSEGRAAGATETKRNAGALRLAKFILSLTKGSLSAKAQCAFADHQQHSRSATQRGL